METLISKKFKNTKHLVPVVLEDENVGFQILKFDLERQHLLKHDKRNRDVNKTHSEKIQNLIKKNGLLRLPIVSKQRDDYRILDGQHLLRGIIGKKTVYAFYCPGDYIKNMFDINDSSKKMTPINQVRALQRNGDKNCEILWPKLIDARIKTVIKPGLIIRLYATQRGEVAIHRRDATRLIKEAKYKVTNDVFYCDNVVKQIEELHAAGLPKAEFYDNALITFITGFGANYKHDTFIRNVKKSSDIKNKNFKLNEKQILIQFKEIYHNKSFVTK